MAKLLGKGSHVKNKSVTIIHSATTETVRLPDDNNGVSFRIQPTIPIQRYFMNQ